MTLAVYFLLDDGRNGGGGTLVPVSRTVGGDRAVANAAMRELLRGPTRDEAAEAAGGPAPFSLVPSDTLLLGLDISAGGVATVDLSREFEQGAESSVMARRLAQVVYTLTQFRNVAGVRFKLDGRFVAASTADGTPIAGAATREDYLALLPPIFVDQPSWGATVSRPIIVRGRASVFEATFQMQLTDDDGRLIDKRSVMASCGAPCWGDWSTELDITDVATERLWVTVYEPSSADSSPQEVRRFPIQLPPRG